MRATARIPRSLGSRKLPSSLQREGATSHKVIPYGSPKYLRGNTLSSYCKIWQ